MRKTFWPAARSATRRSSSATRSTNAAAGTTSPYTNGFAAVTVNGVMITDYTVTRDGGKVPGPPSVVMPRQIDDDAAADEIDRLGREASRAERVEGTSVDRDRLGQILSARAIFLLVVVRREPQGQAQPVSIGIHRIQRIDPKLSAAFHRSEQVRPQHIGAG